MITDFLYFLSVVGIGCIPLGRILWKSQVEGSRFKMFDVRDRLILLVAKKVLDKDSIIFTLYYKRVNNMLRLTEKMHLEGIIQAITVDRTSKAEVDKYNVYLNKIAESLKKEPKEVREVIEEYYNNINEMLLINSNFFYVAEQLSMNYKKLVERLQHWGVIEKDKHNRVSHAFKDIKSERETLGLAYS